MENDYIALNLIFLEMFQKIKINLVKPRIEKANKFVVSETNLVSFYELFFSPLNVVHCVTSFTTMNIIFFCRIFTLKLVL